MLKFIAVSLLVTVISAALASKWQGEGQEVDFSLRPDDKSLLLSCSQGNLDITAVLVDVLDSVVSIIQVFRIPFKAPEPGEQANNSWWQEYKQLLNIMAAADFMRKKCKNSL